MCHPVYDVIKYVSVTNYRIIIILIQPIAPLPSTVTKYRTVCVTIFNYILPQEG